MTQVSRPVRLQPELEKRTPPEGRTKRPDARAIAFLRDAVPPGPETLHVDLINACNFDCVFCWHYSPLRRTRVAPTWARTQLEAERAAVLIRDAAGLGTRRVLFSGGGEPLLHPAAYRLLAQCAELGMATTLISNLSVADVDRLRECGVGKVLANCSAASEAVYLATHPNQRPGTWEALLARVRALASSCEVTLVFVVTRHNVQEVPRALEIAGSVGARRVQYKLADLRGPLLDAAIGPTDRTRLLDQLEDLAHRARSLGVSATLDAFGRELQGSREGLQFVEETGCYVGWYYARVAASGAVYACCKNVPIGHLAMQSFPEIWRGPAYAEFRALTRARDFSRWADACAACGNLSLNVRAARLIRQAAEAGAGP